MRSPKQAQHPLYHLLLIQFLGYTAEEFFQLPASPPTQSQPFGKEPWPCLNPTCEKFRQLCINGCHLTYDKQRGRVTGTFCCTCGFSYSRLGPDRLESARYKIGKVKCYGLVWETALSNFWQDHTISVSEIAKQLGVDFQTVKSQALRLGLAFPRKGPTAKLKPARSLLSVEFNGQKSIFVRKMYIRSTGSSFDEQALSQTLRKCRRWRRRSLLLCNL